MSITVADIPHWRRLFDPTGQPAGYVWTTDGAGGGSYQPAGGGGGVFQTTGVDNIFGGTNALANITTGTTNYAGMVDTLNAVTIESFNTALGGRAGRRVASNQNTAIGYQAVSGVSAPTLTGSDNTGVGARAGEQLNGTATFNTLVGSFAASRLNTGDFNTIVGGRTTSLGIPFNGDLNTILGYEAGFAMNFTASQNTLIGARAGRSISSQSNAVCLGHDAGPTSNVGNRLYIDITRRNDPLIGGDFVARTVSLQNMVFDADQTIGATEDNYVLTYDDGTGLISLEQTSGGLFTEDGQANIIGGSNAATNFTVFASNNFVGGQQAYESFATSPDFSVALGNRAARYATGSRCVTIGYESGRGFSTAAHNGVDNVYVGYRCGVANTGNAQQNTAIGSEAGSRYGSNGNVSVGFRSGSQIGGAGDFNTAVGYEAGRALGGGGVNNTLIGKGAGRNITNVGGDSDNICLGHEAGPTTTAGASDQLWIDVTQRDDPLIKGNFLTRLCEINGQFDADGNTANVSFRVDNNATAAETRMLLWDIDNATLARVSVGAANSGGTGFKVLRIPN